MSIEERNKVLTHRIPNISSSSIINGKKRQPFICCLHCKKGIVPCSERHLKIIPHNDCITEFSRYEHLFTSASEPVPFVVPTFTQITKQQYVKVTGKELVLVKATPKLTPESTPQLTPQPTPQLTPQLTPESTPQLSKKLNDSIIKVWTELGLDNEDSPTVLNKIDDILTELSLKIHEYATTTEDLRKKEEELEELAVQEDKYHRKVNIYEQWFMDNKIDLPKL
jgi:hypothetical protein